MADAWLALGIQELVSEVGRQFNPDGSNYEGSTSYHRLSGELVVYATALVAGLPPEKRKALSCYDHRLIKTRPGLRPAPLPLESSEMSGVWPFPAWYADRIEKIAEFTMHVTKHSGEVVQIGDNDSGRFLRLLPSYTCRTAAQVKERYRNIEGVDNWPDEHPWWDEDVLDHRHLVSAVAGLVPRQDFMDFAGGTFERQVVAGLARGKQFKAVQTSHDSAAETSLATGAATSSVERSNPFELVFHYPGKDLREGLKHFAYQHFGLYIFRSRRLFLSVRCGPLRQEGRGGHSHNDQLSIELEVDGKSVLSDPGSFIYTPMPELRNRYRSDRAHAGFRSTDKESARLDVGLFEVHGDPNGMCLDFGHASFIGQHTGFGVPVTRSVQIEANAVRIRDWVDEGARYIGTVYPFYADPNQANDIYASAGYGKMLCAMTS